MHKTVQARLFPDKSVEQSLSRTMKSGNGAANVASEAAKNGAKTERDIRTACYGRLKEEFGLGAQAAQQAIRKTVDARKTAKKIKKGSEDNVTFRPMSAVPYDDRMLSWNYDTMTVSIWTVDGRIKDVPFHVPDKYLELLKSRSGETRLVHRNGMFFLHAVVEVEEPEQFEPKGYLGIDLGINNIAVTSDGIVYAGEHVQKVRANHERLRKELQAKASKGSRSASRKLRDRRKKEQGFGRDVDHCISKGVVCEAKRTERGIALEDLQGIRDRVSVRKSQRRKHSSWSFHQLRKYIEYKAALAGVPVTVVDPRNTSRECLSCHHVAKENRKRDKFLCVKCGLAGPADYVAAINIGRKAETVGESGTRNGGPVNDPNAPHTRTRYGKSVGSCKPAPSGAGS